MPETGSRVGAREQGTALRKLSVPAEPLTGRAGGRGLVLESATVREVLARFPSGVVVVTALDALQRPVGLTVSAFCSVSLAPMLVLTCVDQKSNTLPAIERSQMFTVNILASDREEMARLFASKRSDKFEGVTIMTPELGRGGPILCDDASAYLVCEVDRSVPAGDHTVMIGRVLEAGLHDIPDPLVYHNRRFASVG